MTAKPSPLVFQSELNSSSKSSPVNRITRSLNATTGAKSSAPSNIPPQAASNTTSFNNKTVPVTPTKPSAVTNMTSQNIHSTFNSSAIPSTAASKEEPQDNGAGTAVAVVITVVLVALFLGLVFYILKRKGKLPWLKKQRRKRRSSTSSSRRALDMEEHEGPSIHDDKPAQERDMFTIDDFDTGRFEDDEESASRADEYYYDEVFGQSEFEDEATNAAVRQFYSGSEPAGEEELLDFDFETLGINISDLKPATQKH